jgi:predicted nucleotidyltransferase
MGPVRIHIPRERIADFCRKHRVRKLSVFGSALRDDFRADSDVDFLVSFGEDAHYSLFDLAAMEEELGAILGRKVDLVEREAIVQSENYIRRRHILQSEEPVYVAG